MAKIAINEEMHLEEEWFDEAKNQTLGTLVNFINHVMNDYYHDYGTVCHAISACAIAAAWAANETEGACGGITGFQSSFVMWDFIKQWSYLRNKCGLKIINYDDMLYPQYGYRLEKTIPKNIWEALQKEAKSKLEDNPEANEKVIGHWQSIVNGNIPFGFTIEKE